jgi:aminopeptidase N
MPKDSDDFSVITSRWSDYRAPNWSVSSTHILVEIDEYFVEVTALHVISRIKETSELSLVLDGKDIPLLKSIKINEKVLLPKDYSVTNKELTIYKTPDFFSLEITTILEPEKNTECEGLYKSDSILLTQMESEGFRRFTYFLDRPDVLSVYTVEIIADKIVYPVLLSNGNLIERKDLENGKHAVVFFDPWPKPSYLFALVAGDLKKIQSSYKTKSNINVSLNIFGTEKQINRLSYALACLERVMKWEEDFFGFEYDLKELNIIAISNFNAGAMENKSLNIFNDCLLVGDIRSATDERLSAIDRVVAHEYLHNITGNRVTCQSWFELTLKEGLTVLRDTLYAETYNDKDIIRIHTVSDLRKNQFREDLGAKKHAIRMESMVSIDNFYTSTVYEKGAEVIRMGLILIGIEKFKAGLLHYFNIYDGQAVRCEDFWAAMNQTSGYDFTRFFRWYFQSGLPIIKIKDYYDSIEKTYSLTIEQDLSNITSERGSVKPFEFPLTLALLAKNEKLLPLDFNESDTIETDRKRKDLTTITIIVRKARQTFKFRNVPEEPATPSLLRYFTSPVRIEYPYTNDKLAHLVLHDTDNFNRFNAIQRLVSDTILKNSADCKTYQTILPSQLIDLPDFILINCDLSPHLKAYLISVPSLAELGTFTSCIDYQKLHRARELFIKAVALKNHSLLWRTVKEGEKAQFVLTTEQLSLATPIGWRALQSICLYYLHRIDPWEVEKYALKVHKNARTMSDEIMAFGLLNRRYNQQSKISQTIFKKRWIEHDDIFPDWFSVPLLNRTSNVSQLLLSLKQSRHFKPQNPNYLKALYGSFSKNLPAFHDESGSGYLILSEAINYISSFNTLLSAYLVKYFEDLPRINTKSKLQMTQSLEWLKKQTVKKKGTEALQEILDHYLTL